MATPKTALKTGERGRTPTVEVEVGRRLRAHREESGLTLRELARRLGLSPSAISQIETGKSRPSVSTLYAMVSELGMSLDELFSGEGPEPVEPREKPPRKRSTRGPVAREPESELGQGERHLQRAGTRKALELESGVRWERLTRNSDPDADFLYVVYDVGGSSSQNNQFIRHSGHEYGLVLSGTLSVTVGFDSYLLGPGDSISFDSTVPHCLRNAGEEPVHGVWFVVGRQSDRRVTFENAASPPPAS